MWPLHSKGGGERRLQSFKNGYPIQDLQLEHTQAMDWDVDSCNLAGYPAAAIMTI